MAYDFLNNAMQGIDWAGAAQAGNNAFLKRYSGLKGISQQNIRTYQDNPQIAYNAFLPQGSPALQNYYKSNFNQVWNDYLLLKAKGGASNASNKGFLNFLNSYDWQGNYNKNANTNQNTGFLQGIRWG